MIHFFKKISLFDSAITVTVIAIVLFFLFFYKKRKEEEEEEEDFYDPENDLGAELNIFIPK